MKNYIILFLSTSDGRHRYNLHNIILVPILHKDARTS